MYQRLIEQIQWFGYRRVISTAVAVAVVAIGAWWVVRVPPAPVESAISFTANTLTSDVSASLPTDAIPSVSIVVHVAGEVKNPGVYTLSNSARMIDAVLAAGGATARADLEVINLATPLMDSSQIYVPAKGTAESPGFARPPTGIKGVTAAPILTRSGGRVIDQRVAVT